MVGLSRLLAGATERGSFLGFLAVELRVRGMNRVAQLLTLLVLESVVYGLFNTTEREVCFPGLLPEVYIIADLHPRTHIERRVASHVAELSGEFRSLNLSVKIIQPIMARRCNDASSPQFSKGHGSNLAHYSAWNDFARNGQSCTVMIFEYDAFAASPTTHLDALTAVQVMVTDFRFLGFCYSKPHNHPSRGHGAAPYCLHAYAATYAGTRLLLERVDTCGPYSDVQVADMCNRRIFPRGWNYSGAALPAMHERPQVQQLFASQGLHNGPFLFSGLYVQAKYDEHPTSLGFKEGDFVSTRGKGSRSVYVFRAGVWVSIAEAEALRRNTYFLSPWQFQQLRLSMNVSDSPAHHARRL